MKQSQFQFSQPMLIKTEYQILQHQKLSEATPLTINLMKTIGIDPDASQKQAVVSLNVQINKKNDSIIENAMFYVEVEMQSQFHWMEDLGEADINTLLQQNAIALLLSYIRPIVAQITNMSPFPVINIPFLNLTNIENETTE